MLRNHRKVNFILVYISALVIFITSAFAFNESVIGLIIILISGCIYLPYSLYKQLRFGGEGQYIKTCLIYIATGLLVIFSNIMNNQFTQSQVNSIVEKIELYKQKNGVYPESLEALVPRYFSRVPVARISMFSIMTKFDYGLSENNKPILQFMGHPPFGRVGYDFERKELYNYD